MPEGALLNMTGNERGSEENKATMRIIINLRQIEVQVNTKDK